MTDRTDHNLGIHEHSPHGLGNRFGRAAWGLVYVLLFRSSPRILHGWRNLLLRLFGANLHRTARAYPRVRKMSNHPAHLRLEN